LTRLTNRYNSYQRPSILPQFIQSSGGGPAIPTTCPGVLELLRDAAAARATARFDLDGMSGMAT
jgi:hypothetical protein